MCPTFYSEALSYGCDGSRLQDHNPDIPFDPQYSYSSNAYLGSPRSYDEAVNKIGAVNRPEQTFMFSEQNPYPIARISYDGMNDNFMVIRPWVGDMADPDSLWGHGDAFATYHKRSSGNDLDEGEANMLFVDGHVGAMHFGVENVEESWTIAWPKKEKHKGYNVGRFYK